MKPFQCHEFVFYQKSPPTFNKQFAILSFVGSTFTCEGCGKMFTSINFLERHKKYHCMTRNVNRTWDCAQCNKKFASPTHPEVHFCTRANEKSNQTVMAVNQSGKLTKRLRNQTGEKSYQCTQCNKAFNQSCDLTKHLRTHTSEKPYQCTQCNKAFSGSSTFSKHLRTHTGKKPYQCTQCNKAFNRFDVLTTHLRTHTGEKRYQCTQCNKAFNMPHHLTTHLRTHTGLCFSDLMAKDEIRVKANSKTKKLFTLKERRIASLMYNRCSTVCFLFLFLLLRFVSFKSAAKCTSAN